MTTWVHASKERTKLGNEIFIQTLCPQLDQKKLGLVCNHTSVLHDGKSLIEALLEIGVHVEAVFAPEHGFQGELEAGAEIQDSLLEEIKIFSLYGKNKKPTQEQARSIDAFVYDIQDVGTRFYTYITTLKHVMEAAADFGKAVYVLDRPNPAGGHIVEGPLLRSAYESFIGATPIPVRYGLTVGELALMMKGEGWVPPQVELHVVRMMNWSRRYFWKETGLPWIPTSPNIPLSETAIIYPGTGLLGALTVNQGLGTMNPFLQFGAPWFDSKAIIQILGGGARYGAELEPLIYTPKSLSGKTLHPPYENIECQGINVRIHEKDKFYSLHFTLALIKAIRETHPGKIRLHRESLNRMFGNDLLERYIKDTLSYEDLLTEMEKDEKAFLQMRQKYLLYD
ncbi:MAG: DUF1343 domain-containing protein [Candidatus Aminicenantes bacterium]|nr:MAG: DUF1343 domain-containing protein [Candidatus Aminicenantes bacterium]